MVAVDAHSKWLKMAIMKSTTAITTIENIDEMFTRFECPIQSVFNNGPQLVSEGMTAFLQANWVQHIKLAPFHPATDGLAERFVQTLKHELKNSQGQGTFYRLLHRFLLTCTTKVSPATPMFKRDLGSKFDLFKHSTAVKDTVQLQTVTPSQQVGVPLFPRCLFLTLGWGWHLHPQLCCHCRPKTVTGMMVNWML